MSIKKKTSLTKSIRSLSVPGEFTCKGLQNSTQESQCQGGSLSTGDWLLEVDKLVRIPGVCTRTEDDDTVATCHCDYCQHYGKIYDVAVNIVETVRSKMLKKFPEVTFETMPIGSFKLGAKILECNEFDFLLVFDQKDQTKETQGKSLDITNYFDNWFQRRQSETRLEPQSDNGEPRVKSVYKHGPAWCTEIGWESGGNDKVISVDISLGVRHVGDKLKDRCTSLAGSELFKSLHSSLVEDAIYVNVNQNRTAITTSVLDQRMFEVLHSTSPNILIAYRLMKSFFSLLFPKWVKYSDVTAEGYTVTAFVSSHKLKNVILKQAQAHPHRSEWETEDLADRIAEMFTIWREYQEHPFQTDMVNDGLPSREIRTCKWLENFLKKNTVDMSVKSKVDTSGEANTEKFAYVKIRDYKLVSTITRLNKLLKETDKENFSEGQACLAYFTSNCLIDGWKVDQNIPLVEYMNECKLYLHRKLRKAPYLVNEKPQSDTRISGGFMHDLTLCDEGSEWSGMAPNASPLLDI